MNPFVCFLKTELFWCTWFYLKQAVKSKGVFLKWCNISNHNLIVITTVWFLTNLEVIQDIVDKWSLFLVLCDNISFWKVNGMIKWINSKLKMSQIIQQPHSYLWKWQPTCSSYLLKWYLWNNNFIIS